MLSSADALERIKGRATDAVPEELIRRLARETGHRWRDRDLGPVVTTHLFLQQVLHGNTAVAHLRRLSGLDFSDAAYARPGPVCPCRCFNAYSKPSATACVKTATSDRRPAGWATAFFCWTAPASRWPTRPNYKDASASLPVRR